MDLKTLQALPKVELHCHLDGSLSLKAIRQLAKMAQIPVPESDQALAQLTQVQEPIANLGEYLEKFDFVAPLLQTKAALKLAAFDVLEQAAAENVQYIEIRFAPAFSLDQGLSLSETIAAVIDGLKQGEAAFGIHSNLLVCGMRQLDNAANIAAFKAAVPYLNQGLGGVDFAGNEADFPPADLKPAIAYARTQGLPLTLHAGECHCAHNIYESIHLGATRIGHGTALYEQPDLAAYIKAHHTCLELCLTSNLQTKAVTNIADYPYDLIRQNQLQACINTDNRTVSNTTLTKEYALFQKYFQTSAATFLQFNLDGIAAAFCDPALKVQLTRQFKAAYQALS
ncbi:MAG: adenosine deaminase [Lactobacillus sp.]|jgi:adenosine deaminase|nr:adenosine deaminase [Lactobacillus sp.]